MSTRNGHDIGASYKPTSSELAKDPAKLADTVERIGGLHVPWSTCTVENITHEDGITAIHLVRPYIHNADFSYTGGVLTYIGMERYTVTLEEFCGNYRLLQRTELR